MNSSIMLDGFPFPNFFDKENFYLMKNLQLRPGDIVISTYPKCGTNWIAYITWSILHPEENPPDGTRVHSLDVPFVDSVGLGKWAECNDDVARCFATHLPFKFLPKNEKAKFVVVTRNPFDCIVSLYHFLESVYSAENQFIPDSFFEIFMTGDLAYGDYYDHLLDWYEHRNDANVHFVTYEQLKKDPKAEILKLARFLGLHQKLEEDGGRLLDKVVHQTSFDFMKGNVEYKVEIKDGALQNVPFIRKGQVGTYKDDLSEEQLGRLKEKMNKYLSGTELLEAWKDL